ncbi:SPOR domain-containing protein [Nostoc sp. DSM 114161]|jgi:hypothetical protein|uniref:hypothetical protein n=1 Tax=Nostoc sp. DSM 114161 TaxID=3440143 RepID=UPI00404582AF
MTENPLNDSGNQSPKTLELKPALAAALASLEVPLDRELARYRRTRTGSASSNQYRVGSYINSQSQQFTAVSTALSITAPSVGETKIDVPPPLPVSVPVNTQVTPASSVVKIDEPAISVTPNPPADSDPVAVNTEEVSNLNNVPPRLDSAKKQTQPPPPPPNFTSSIVPTVVKDTNGENLVQPDDGLKQPDDYLESSEALLRSLTEEQPQTKKPNNYSDSLLSPLGIGSMLLLLVASLTLGYVIFNPKSLPQWNLAKLFNSNSPAAPENTQEVASNVNAQSQIQAPSTPIPKYPNLAAEEFPEVRDPNDVVGLKPKAQTTPPVVTNPVVPQTNPQAALPEPIAPLKPTNPIAIAPVPTPKPLPLAMSPTPKPKTSPGPNAEIKPSTDGFYHVVIDNQGRALASAREIIPDAYLSPNKQLVFLGAFKTKEQVERHMRLLESRGIKARVQEP